MAVSAAVLGGGGQASNEMLSKAAQGWDPVGAMLFDEKARGFSSLSRGAGEADPGVKAANPTIAEYGAQVNDDLSWIPETVNKVGLAGDEGLREIGLNPDSVKMAIVGFFAPYMLPLVSAALVKARGGSWEDAALSAAASYAASYVGAQAGSWVNNSMGSTVTGTTASAVTEQAAKQGLQLTAQEAASMAAQNMVAATAAAATKAGVGSTVGQLIQTGKIDLNKVITAASTSGLNAGINQLAPQIPGWTDLPKEAQNAIKTAAGGFMSGKNMDTIGAQLVSGFISDQVNQYSSGLIKTAQSGYDALANKLSELSGSAAEWLGKQGTSLKDTFASMETAYNTYGTKAGEVNKLITQYNAAPTPELLEQIKAGTAELDTLKEQYNTGSTAYNEQIKAFEDQYKTPIQEVHAQLLEQRQGLIKSSVLAANPDFDPDVYMSQLPAETKAKYPNASAEEIFLQERQANPSQVTSWEQLISNTTPDKVGAIDDLYKATTGFELNKGTADADGAPLDPYAWKLYQDKVAGSVDWYLAEADKAKAAGDFTKYSQLMGDLNKTYSGAFDQDLSAGTSGAASSKFLGNVLGIAMQGRNAYDPAWRPQVAPGAQPAAPGQMITSYGFGEFNPYVTDLMQTTEGANKFLRDKYTYDKNAVDARLSGITGMDFSQQPGALGQFQSGIQGSVASGNMLFMPTALQQEIANQFSNLGTSGYNTAIGTTNALDYLKSGAVGGLGSYFEAYSNPYALAPKVANAPGGLNQVAANWTNNSGVTSPVAQNMLAKNLTS